MTEVLFYHLESSPLERVLPELLRKCLDRGWRAVVQVGTEERLRHLDDHLWTFSDASFLPHGTAADGNADAQPIWLTCAPDNPNGAPVRFCVDGALPPDTCDHDRVVLLFDGGDPQAVEGARGVWKQARDRGHDVQYWRQTDQGRWQRQDETK